MKRIAVMVMLAVFFSCTMTGCSWMGRQTGKAVEKVKQAPDDFMEGYEQGKQEGTQENNKEAQ